jgi:hypothetical protein
VPTPRPPWKAWIPAAVAASFTLSDGSSTLRRNFMADEDQVLEHVGLDRRRFVKRVVIGTAFAVPVVSSFSMTGVQSVASAQVSGNVAI